MNFDMNVQVEEFSLCDYYEEYLELLAAAESE